MRSLRTRLLLIASVIAVLMTVGVSSASAADIEGVWAFNGGQIGIGVPLSNGTYVGTVVQETTFAECPHPVGQQIWTGIRPQADGSYWGLHQWYYEKSGCLENPTRGPAAFRVLKASSGATYLKVCLSEPGTTQPTIAADGTSADATYGCVNSALSATIPTTETKNGSGTGTTTPSTTPRIGIASFKELVSLPNNKKCFSSRSFQIHIQDPKYDAFKTISITIKGHKLKAVRHGNVIVATVSLKGLPKGSFTVLIKATTYLGQHLSGSRTYHTCASKASRHKATTKLG